ncbi:MAG TPA: glucose 1-dehydrogenase [Acidimicrobiales bacterium]|nr:glucose 1-dehydrogenase [Acidimicrobiales bacterium]
MTGRLDGKVALITGAARGQGAAEARLFAAEGAKVVVTDVLDAEGELVAKELGPDVAVFHHHDVTEPAAWTDALATALDVFGRLDVLVNNAGVFRYTPLATTPVEDYDAVIRINQRSVFLGMQAVIPAMTEVGGGSIVNVSSIAGLRGSAGTAAYSASKWAVRGMTKVAAMELAALHIRVNSIHPGIIDTPMLNDLLFTGEDSAKQAIGARIPLGEVATAEQVARMALFLASDDSDHSTGSEFVVDGGLTAAIGWN